MDMKTKTIVTAMLLATAYVLLVNLMFLSGFGKDEMVKVGWYSEFGGNSTTTLCPLYVWLNFPYTVCFLFLHDAFLRQSESTRKQVAGRNGFCAVVCQSRSDFGEYRLRLVYGIQF